MRLAGWPMEGAPLVRAACAVLRHAARVPTSQAQPTPNLALSWHDVKASRDTGTFQEKKKDYLL